MSYLIALYVYYHGNNLPVFGITPGMADENKEKNKGLIRPEEINPELVDQSIIDAAIEQQKKEAKTAEITNWEDMMKQAIMKAQQESFKMYQYGNMENSIFERTPETIIDEFDGDGAIPMDFFSSINNL